MLTLLTKINKLTGFELSEDQFELFIFNKCSNLIKQYVKNDFFLFRIIVEIYLQRLFQLIHRISFMSNKDSNKSQDRIAQLKSEASPKSKKAIFKEVTNTNLNINTSIDLIKKEDQRLKKQASTNNDKPTLQQSQKTELHKQKVQALKALKDIEKQQKQIQVKIQKSSKKLPEIRQSPTNKQNLPSRSVQKRQPVSTHLRTQSDNHSSILRTNKNNTTQANYSVINGMKVFMSEDDVAKLKKLKLEYKKREQQIKKKVVAHDLFIEKMKTQEIMSKENKLEEERHRRLKSIEERQKILSKQRQQKLQRFQEENKKLKQLKKSRKLFQKMQEKFHQVQEKQKLNLNQLMKSRVGQGTVNFDQIKQHQKQYLERNRQNIQNSRMRIKSKIKEVQEEFNHLNLHKSQFYQRVKHQKKEILHEMEENDRKRKVCSQKIKEYKDVVRENYMPTVVKVQKPEQKKKPSFNLLQIHNMGNDYMKQGGKLIDRNKSLNQLEAMRKQQVEKKTKNTYKNYLHENRTEASPQQKSRTHSKPKQNLVEKELKSINAIKNPKEKYEKIKLLHNKIQKDLKSSMQVGGKIKLRSGNLQSGSENQKQVKQIKAKLQLLEGLEA